MLKGNQQVADSKDDDDKYFHGSGIELKYVYFLLLEKDKTILFEGQLKIGRPKG
jgi:hypothetical protein